jgi:hypothetical protein
MQKRQAAIYLEQGGQMNGVKSLRALRSSINRNSLPRGVEHLRMSWDWFGASGCISIGILLVLLLAPNAWRIFSGPNAERIFPFLMLISVVGPIVASMRSGRWWLISAIAGVTIVIRLFWLLAV